MNIIFNLDTEINQVIGWRVLKTDNTLVTSGTTTVNGNSGNVSVGTLPDGNYIFQLNGISCNGTSNKAFSVSNNTSNCEYGPDIYSILLVTTNEIVFQFSASNVNRFKAQIKNNVNAVIKETEMVYLPTATPEDIAAAALPTKTVQFFNSSTVTFQFATPLTPQSGLTLNLQATSCISDVDSEPFSISIGTLAFSGGYPSYVATVDGGNLFIKINQTGNYLTIIHNDDTDTDFYNEVRSWTAETAVEFVDVPEGNYTITVDSLSADIEIVALEDVPEVVAAVGQFTTDFGGRTYTYNKTGKFEIGFNADGTLSDITLDINTGFTPNKVNGTNVFYLLGYSPFRVTNMDNSYTYAPFQNVFLEDGFYRIAQVITNGASNITEFSQRYAGWPPGIDKDNTLLSEIFITIKTNSADATDEDWLKLSRVQLFYNSPRYTEPDGTFGTYQYNQDKGSTAHQAFGINTTTENVGLVQPNTWRVWQYYVNNTHPTPTELYNWGRNNVVSHGLTRNSMFMDEVPENVGDDAYIYPLVQHVYRGALDGLRLTDPTLDVKDSGLYGSYGGDSYLQTWASSALDSSRSVYIEALTTKVWNTLLLGGAGWAGIAGYYAYGDINYRNVNIGFYFSMGHYMTPYSLVYHNERIKIGTKTYEGIDRERKWVPVTMPMVQNLSSNGIEWNSSGEVTKFPGGNFLSKMNNSVPWEEMYVLAFYSTWIGGGIAIWGAKFGGFGSDPTKVDLGINNPILSWDQGGDGGYGSFIPGVNGAPNGDPSGLYPIAFASPVDTAYAGWKKAKALKSRSTTIYHASYTSSRGSQIATAGSTGLHLNGFGPLNTGSYTLKDAYDAKKGLALVGSGPGGKVAVYYNGFLSAQEYEDDVTITHNGTNVNIGRVYGRHIKTLEF